MVYGVVTLRLIVPLEQREVHDPQRCELLRIAQAQLLGHFEAQGAQLRQRLELLAGLGAAARSHGGDLFGCVEFVNGRLHAVLPDTYPDQSFRADLLALDELRQRVDLLAGVRSAARGGESGDVFGIVEDAEAVSFGKIGNV